MSSRVVSIKIEELGEVVTGKTPSTKNSEFWGGQTPFVTPTDMGTERYVKTERFLTENGVETVKNSLCPKGTVMVSCIGTIGKIAIATENVVTNQQINSIVPNENFDSEYIYYLLQNSQNILRSHSSGTGTTIPIINKSSFERITLKGTTEKKAQEEIAKILGDLDRKIELNRRMNETLEQIGQALFKHYFIDNPERENWETKPLDEIADFKNGLACQKYPAKQGEQKLRVIKIKEMSSGFTDGSDTVGQDFPQEYIIENGDVLFAWSGTLMTKIWNEGPGALNQHIFKVTSENYPKWFYYYWVNEHLKRFKAIAKDKAVTMGHIKRSHLSEAVVKIPPNGYLKRFDEALSALLDKQIRVTVEGNSLAALRDTLLPKLMSGDVKI